MKRFLCILLTIALMLAVCACSAPAGDTEDTKGTTLPQQTSDPVKDDKVLKVLAIGNSFSTDTTHYLAMVAKAEGFKEVRLGNLYISGCKVETHALNAKDDQPAYKFYTNFDGSWSSTEGVSLSYALKLEDWDIITMQQGSSQSGKPDTYEPHLTELIQYVNENKTNPYAKLAWNMTWAYQSDFTKDMFQNYDRDQMKMYNAICDAVKTKVQPHSEFAYMIPTGTAIQNVRTSYFGDTLTRDGYHLSDLGRIIASYTWLATFLGEPLTEINTTMVGTSLVLTDSDKQVIMEAVNAALEQPLAITQSLITAK